MRLALMLVYTSLFAFACGVPEPAEAVELSGEVGMTSDYIFRGETQTQGGSAIQGSVN